MNVFDYAMKMEEDGKAFYEKLAKKTSVDGLRNIFARMAEDEQKHFETFQALKAEKGATAMEDTAVLEGAKNIFEQLPKGEEALKGLKGDLEAYRFAMKVEAESFRLYEEAAAKESDGDVKNLLLRIASEEQKHFNILQNIFDFVNAPNQYLEWGEFSNIEEFRQFGRDVD